MAMLSLSANPILDSTEITDTLTWSFDSNAEGLAQSFDYLEEGETLILTYTITATDNDNNATTEDVVITITGTNDDPVISDVLVTGSDTETDGQLNASGSITVKTA